MIFGLIAVKIARIMSETEIENREKDKVKEEFGPRGSNSQKIKFLGGLNMG